MLKKKEIQFELVTNTKSLPCEPRNKELRIPFGVFSFTFPLATINNKNIQFIFGEWFSWHQSGKRIIRFQRLHHIRNSLPCVVGGVVCLLVHVLYQVCWQNIRVGLHLYLKTFQLANEWPVFPIWFSEIVHPFKIPLFS